MERELQTNLLTRYDTYFVSGDQPVNSSCTGISSTTCYSSQLLNDGLSSPIIDPSSSGMFQSGALAYHRDSSMPPLLGDPLQEFLELDESPPITTPQVQSNCVGSSNTLYQQNEWCGWMTNDGTTSTNWNEVLINANAIEHGTQVMPPLVRPSVNPPVEQPQFQQALPSNSGDICTMSLPGSSGNDVPSRQRMRWTPEKHELFLQAVKQLGGCDKATPKLVLKHMNCPDMTILHVKSHLQKYRTARYRPEPHEGSSERLNGTGAEMPSLDSIQNIGITEALRLQMELQKQLHEQLERQRKLQLQIEENGKYIREILDKQCQADNQQRRFTSAEVQSSDEASSATGTETSERHHTQSVNNTIDQDHAEESNGHAGRKKKMAMPESSNNAKRLKCSATGIDVISVPYGLG